MMRLLAMALLLCAACGPDALVDVDDPKEPKPDPTTPILPDDETPDAPNDPPVWSWTEPACESALVRNATRNIAPTTRSQMGPALAFDGRLYVTWSEPPLDPNDSNFDVKAIVLGCDLEALSRPVRLNELEGWNDTFARVATTKDGALVAWSSTGGRPRPALRVRALNREGVPTTAPLTPFGDDAAWTPALASLPDGNAVLALTHGIDETPFRATVGVLNPSGELQGDEHPTSTTNHLNAAVATTLDGIHLVWEQRDDASGGISVIDAADVTRQGVGSPRRLLPGRDGSYPQAQGHLAQGASAWTVFASTADGGSSIVLAELGGALRTELGASRKLNIAPTVAASADGGAVAWVVNGSPVKTLHVQRFRKTASGLSTKAAVTVPTNELLAAPPALVHLSGNDFAIAWVEGAYPNRLVKIRALTLD